ncbi:thiamine pyrophosphate-binding protein [Jatrophihabitans cynanchi]|uniref:Thiamine pyrophosphate-binding protein n=1 Tax=Jatrophihabitans cynanchi TaxID=2944128 RepID=A0ABY7K0K2_9ACTN|nr:thiamine pyrophosphate-binding protein [Jatrophihabitans sp. SB3-54]WAX58375.1 thiamine pyrophosphate-binding protein [Jatrophihabitans sp. SB3-54]
MTVFEDIAAVFVDEGAHEVFGMVGDGNVDFCVALAAHPHVRFHHVRHEGPGVTMADGWAKAVGGVGVATATQGPGVTQLGTALVAAARLHVPVVVYVGDLGVGGDVQSFDQRQWVLSCESGYESVTEAETAVEITRRAFRRARDERRPIVLGVPPSLTSDDEWDDESAGEQTVDRPARSAQRIAPDPDRLAEAARLIAGSSRPVILAGKGAVDSDVRDLVLRLAERTGALLATTLLAKNWFAGEKRNAAIAGLYAHHTAVEMFAQADCVIGLGTSFDSFTLERGYMFPEAKFVHVDRRDPYPMGTGEYADAYVQGDVGVVTGSLLEALADAEVRCDWAADVEQRLVSAPIDDKPIALEPNRCDPRAVMVEIDDVLPEAALVVGTGHFWTIAIAHLQRFRWPFTATYGFGSIGNGLPVGIGFAAALKERPVILIEGDASIRMHIQELEPARAAGLRMCVVVINDEAIGAEFHKMRAHGLETDLAVQPGPDLVAIAKAFGWTAVRVESSGGVREAIGRWNPADGPMLIDVRVSRNVTSRVYRTLYFGESD